ncbi:fla cluster protein flaF [Candidatus Halobonum tyrrellensis]|uniref:Fla cluster protein flaF n=1 Tax=Candidatus Halobonum tyrrellensis G22 TaxID=1324957 RepID=V4HNM4_9EURY|nr:fla cluster protein flaF [Candidatus Halobonum tyrrellensis]ESP89524.1 fla cluster protein flaF [Candidatus Halobonum tyrrellensis G22]
MGLSVSVSTAVVCLGLFVAAGVAYPAVANGAERVSEANDAAADRALDRQQTGVAAANATYHAGNDTLVVTARNDGSTTLDVTRTTLLADNEYVPSTATVAGANDTALWLPGETARFESGLSTAPDRVTVVVDHGVRDWVDVEVA